MSFITQSLREIVEGAIVPLWIRGEVSDFKKHRNGHWYFTLRDAGSQLRCVAWARDQSRIPAAPDDGMKIAAFGQLTVYTARGEVQFTVREMEAEGDGLRQKALERTKKRLEEDGLLAPERKRKLPRAPRRIAVITSRHGAALHDIVHVVRKRCPSVDIILIETKVQGDGAEKELCFAVKRLSRWKGADLVIIGRGGGAREDLWAFNDERLARLLAECPIPTISAVGHEVDATVCDLVCDYRAATPSAAAEAAVPDLGGMEQRLRSRALFLRRSLTLALRHRTDRLARFRRDIVASLRRELQGREVQLRSMAGRINDLSPLAVMSRGYGVAQTPDGKTIGRATDIKPGDHFSLRLTDGSVDAVAERVTLPKDGKADVL